MAFWNRRYVRIAVGIALLGGAAVAILPTLTGYTSLDGTVNARIAVVSAPIDGTVTVTPPKIGTAATGGSNLLGIRNDQIVRTAEVQMGAELEAAKERLRAIEAQRADLSALRRELATRWQDYQQASIQNLTHEIEMRRQRMTTAVAQLEAAAADLTRKQRLGVTGIVSESVVQQARAASVGAENARAIANAEIEQLNQQLDSVRRGIFIGEGRNDVPYSQQRIDEISIQLADLQFRERDLRARIAQLSTQQEEEHEHNRTLGYVELQMPFDGVIWRNNVVEGKHVIAGNELVQVLDCRDLFVDILVSEVDYDQIYPGRKAQIRLFGSSDVLDGQVLSVRGSAAVVEDVILAAKPPQSRGKDARIRVGLPPSALNSDYANFCQVGRSVQVRFKTRSVPIVRWLKALWFSIT